MANSSRKSPIERAPFEPSMVRSLRKKAGLTQFDMAKSLGISLARYHSYEYGACQKIPTLLLARLRTLAAHPPKRLTRGSSAGLRVPCGDRMVREFRELRERLGLNQEQMADRLGLQVATYADYERGNAHTVPARVVYEARALASGKAVRHAPNGIFASVSIIYRGRSMSEIARAWAARLGFDLDTPIGVPHMAATIGVDAASLKRWLKQGDPIRRSPKSLIDYERRVTKVETELRAKFRLGRADLAAVASAGLRSRRESATGPASQSSKA